MTSYMTPAPWKAEFSEYGGEIWFGGNGCGLWQVGPAFLGGEGLKPGGLERMAADARAIAELPAMISVLRGLTAIIHEMQANEDCDAMSELGGYVFGDVMSELVEAADAIIGRVDGAAR